MRKTRQKGMLIVGINGSPNKSGLCAKLLNSCLAQSQITLFFYNKKLAKTSERGWMDKDIKLLGRNTVRLAEMVSSLYKGFWWDYRALR